MILIRNVLLLAVLAVGGKVGVYAVTFYLIFQTLRRPGQWSVISFLFASLLVFFNPSLISNAPGARELLLLTLLFVCLSKKAKQFDGKKLELRLYILYGLFFIASLFGSLYTDMSIIRVCSLAVITFILFKCVAISQNVGFDFERFFVRLTPVFVLLSFILIFLPIGYSRQNGIFSGILVRSQEFSQVLVPLLLIFLFSQKRKLAYPPWFSYFTILVGVIELYLASSRVAMAALVIAVIFHFMFSAFWLGKLSIRRVRLFSICSVILFVLILLYQDVLSEKVKSFVMKGADVDMQNSSLLVRKSLAIASIENFKEFPFTGVGFGVQTYFPRQQQVDLVKSTKYVPGTDFIYSRPLEKGNLYLSILEEAGLFVTLYFLFLIFKTLKYFIDKKNALSFAVFISFLVNFNGEANLFAPNGLGNFQLLILVILTCFTNQTLKDNNLHGQK